MMRAAALLIPVACAAILAGCDQKAPVPENSGATTARTFEDPRPEGVSSPNDPVTVTLYIPQATISDMYEVQAGELALVRARDPRVRQFAQMMVTDHRKSAEAMQQFVKANPVNIAPPQNLDARRTAMLDSLRKSTDAEFDATYLGQQAAAHDEALSLHSSFAKSGAGSKLSTLARAMIPIIEHHRKSVEKLMAATGAKP